MTTEEKFKAAVNVIRNLPKNGPVQPSNQVMLKFYAYYKQATEGPNISPKPAFWDLVKRAKWDAWTKLGDMDRESAMIKYVEEFKKIVESVSNSSMENVNKSEIDSFYASVPVKDLELVVGPIISKAGANSSKSDVSLSSYSDLSQENALNGIPEPMYTKSETSMNGDYKPNYVNGYTNGIYKSDEDEDDEEFFLDTIENSEQILSRNKITSDERIYRANVQHQYMNGYPLRDDSNNNTKLYSNLDAEMSQQISNIIICLQKDLEKVVKSVDLIEQRIGQLQGKIVTQKSYGSPFMTSQIVPFVMLLSWPIILQLLIYWFRRKKN